MDAFTRKTAVITGATGAIGGAIAARLLASGASAVLVGRTRPALNRLVRDSRWSAASVRCCVADLAEGSAVQRLTQDILDNCPQVHVLIHAAGIIVPAKFQESRLADLDSHYLVNVRAPYQLTQALLPRMLPCGGQVVFINSSVGIKARMGVSQYAATKHALRAVADSLREEVNAHGVRVLSVFLGRTASGMQAGVHEHERRTYRPDMLIQPEDVASIVVHALQLPRTAEITDLHVRPMRKS